VVHALKKIGGKMTKSGYAAVAGTVISVDGEGIWLRTVSGDHLHVTAALGSAVARPGHEVAAAGTEKAAGLQAELLVNRSIGVCWASTPFEVLNVAQVAVGHCITLLLMAIPIGRRG
jgi:hypothetical protein